MTALFKIENIYSRDFEELYSLYTHAFPIFQRRSWAGIEQVFNKKPNFSCNIIKQDDVFVGLLSYWTFDKFVYIEHFAIHPNFQNKGIGSDVMKQFMQQISLPIVIETETPRNIQANQRINFYERLGFYIIPEFYMQPPYDNGQVILSMLIMTTDYHFVSKHFQQVKNTLYKEVYKYDPKKKK
ncbi:MAG: hypothetical protein AUK44_07325 [Porphyromonadaceae bacterium CG2_30_38_12]|nr:MAG: hypothetical protein AUK44_07325 [Porphyromonadaceae bacterium CG2_30_38_12]